MEDRGYETQMKNKIEVRNDEVVEGVYEGRELSESIYK
jgi:hypothetical protein